MCGRNPQLTIARKANGRLLGADLDKVFIYSCMHVCMHACMHVRMYV